MKAQKLFLYTILVLLCINSVKAQLINCNPDPNGEPWWCGNLKLTPEVIAKIQAIPIMTISPSSVSTLMATVVIRKRLL